jgi:hypothetical protein
VGAFRAKVGYTKILRGIQSFKLKNTQTTQIASPGRDVPIRRPEQPEDNDLAQPRSNSLKDVCVRAHKDSLTTATTLTVELSMYKLRVSEVQSTQVRN